MSTTGIDAFDKTIQVTNTWLNEIMADHGSDRQVAWHVLSAVLHVLRDRLTTDLSANLGAQLPLLVRGTYYDQFEPSRQPDKSRSLDEFLDQVQQELRYTRPVDSKEAVRSVFKCCRIISTRAKCVRFGRRFPEKSAISGRIPTSGTEAAGALSTVAG